MKKLKGLGKKKEVNAAELKDVKDIIKRQIKEERKYLALMAKL